MWQPRTWTEVIQLVASFLAKLVTRSHIISEEKLAGMRSHVSQLQQAYHNFHNASSAGLVGERPLSNTLAELDRYDTVMTESLHDHIACS